MSNTVLKVALGVLALIAAVEFGMLMGRSSTAPAGNAPVLTQTQTGDGTVPPSARIQTMGERSAPGGDSRRGTDGNGTGVFINQRELTPEMVQSMVAIYRFPPPRGQFWYDARSGLYGMWGRETAGYIHPGHDFGPLSPRASAGDTGVFINGREINTAELDFLQILFNGEVKPGRAWLDGTTWNIGAEGSPQPIANLAVAIQQAQQRRSAVGNAWSWRDGSGAAMASDGRCTMMAVPGAPVYGTSGC